MIWRRLPRAICARISCSRTLVVIVVWLFCACILLRYVLLPADSSTFLSDYLHRRQILESSISTSTHRSLPPPQRLMQLQPLVDTSPSLSEKQLLALAQRRVDSLPTGDWLKSRHGSSPRRLNSTCARLPLVYDLKFNNLYWQVMESSNGTYNFYAAYYDNRSALATGPLVRILVMIDRIRPTLKTYCQLWFDGRAAPVIVPVMEYKYVWNQKWGNFKQGVLQPYLMACELPKDVRKQIPAVVTLVETQCQTASVALRVVNNVPDVGTKRDFAVCVKGLLFPDEDQSVRLVEWLELLKILGAHKVYMYQLEIHPNITKVLNHYENLGLVELRPLTLAGEQPNLSGLQRLYLNTKVTNKRQSELVPYNDCFYRHMNLYEYLVLVDTDEVIMPLEHRDWPSLMLTVRKLANAIESEVKKPYASYNVRNVYFFGSSQDRGKFDDIPAYMHMLQHVYRSVNYTKPGHYIKSFHRTDRVIALHNHFPLECLGGCRSYSIDPSVAHLQHYRADCIKSLAKECDRVYKKESVLDDNIWRYKEELTLRVTRTLVELGFLPPEGEQLLEYIQTGISA